MAKELYGMSAKAVLVRAEFKARGWTPKMVGVRSDYSTINIEIKSPGFGRVCVAQVEDIAGRHEEINRCEGSGEILSGGKYVFARYDHEALANYAAQYLADIEGLASGDSVSFGFVSVSKPIDRSGNGRWYVHHADRRFNGEAWTAGEAAETVARATLEAQAMGRYCAPCHGTGVDTYLDADDSIRKQPCQGCSTAGKATGAA